MEIYFDNILIDEDYYTALSTNFVLFEDTFYLGSTASNAYNISIDKDVISSHPNIVTIKNDNELVATLVVDKIEENDFEYKYTLTDKMVNLEFKYDASLIFNNGSTTLLQIVQDICNKAGIELATIDFRGHDKVINWYDNTITAREYIGYIAELNGGYAQIGKDGKLYFIKQNTPSVKTISIEDCSDFQIGEKHIITRIVYEQGSLKYEYGDETGNTLYLSEDNVYITEQSEVEEIFNEIKGFEFYSFQTNNCPIDYNIMAGQIVTFTDGVKDYPTIVGYDLTYNGGWYGGYSLDVATKKQEETQVVGTSEKIRKLSTKIDRESGKITQLAQETSENTEKIAKHEISIEGITEEVKSITGLNNIENGDFKNDLEKWMTSALGGAVDIKTYNDKKYANLLSMYSTTRLSQIISGLFKDIEYILEFDIFDDNPDNISVEENATFSINILQNVTEEELETVYTEKIQVTGIEERKKIKFTLNRNSKDVLISFDLEANGYLEDATSVMIGNIVLSGGDITEKLAKLNTNADKISSEVSKKVNEDEVCSVISQSAEEILLKGNRVIIESNNFSLDKYGNMNCQNANIQGSVRTGTSGQQYLNLQNGVLIGGYNQEYGGKIDFSGTLDNKRALTLIGNNGIVLKSSSICTNTNPNDNIVYQGKTTSLEVLTDVEYTESGEVKTIYSETITWVNGIMVTSFN